MAKQNYTTKDSIDLQAVLSAMDKMFPEDSRSEIEDNFGFDIVKLKEKLENISNFKKVYYDYGHSSEHGETFEFNTETKLWVGYCDLRDEVTEILSSKELVRYLLDRELLLYNRDYSSVYDTYLTPHLQ